jgi:hypothetical protein
MQVPVFRRGKKYWEALDLMQRSIHCCRHHQRIRNGGRNRRRRLGDSARQKVDPYKEEMAEHVQGRSQEWDRINVGVKVPSPKKDR